MSQIKNYCKYSRKLDVEITNANTKLIFDFTVKLNQSQIFCSLKVRIKHGVGKSQSSALGEILGLGGYIYIYKVSFPLSICH